MKEIIEKKRNAFYEKYIENVEKDRIEDELKEKERLENYRKSRKNENV